MDSEESPSDSIRLPGGAHCVLLGAAIVLGLLLSSIVSGDSDVEARVTAAKHRRVYCTPKRHPRGCVRVPKSAKRPRDITQQGGASLDPADIENGGGLGGGPGDHGASALRWAQSQLGLKRWAWRCERFVEEAYGTRSQFSTSAQAAAAVTLHGGPATNAPPGSLMYFAANVYNRDWGHVGISRGKGRMISALKTVEVTDVTKSAYWRGLYLGWARAPADWPGRIPPPPGPTTADPTLSVRITAPAPGTVQSGTVALLATAAGAGGGVQFAAYYATDPQDAGSRGWHTLGAGSRVDDSWQFDWDTAAVPDQGFGNWGTVNIAAIAVDDSGRLTGTRDYRRISIDNTTGSLAMAKVTTPVAQPALPRTYPETTGDEVADTWANYLNAGGLGGQQLRANQTVQVSCRIEGYQVPDGNTWWYRIAEAPWSNVFYATADDFYNDGQTSGTLSGTPFVDVDVPFCA